MAARQDAIKIAWEKPKIVTAGNNPENKPSARSGHTVTVVGNNAYVFGGLDARRPPGPNNEMFLLKLGSLQSEWSRMKIKQDEGKVIRHILKSLEKPGHLPRPNPKRFVHPAILPAAGLKLVPQFTSTPLLDLLRTQVLDGNTLLRCTTQPQFYYLEASPARAPD